MKQNPFFCRSAIVFQAEDWLRLRSSFSDLKIKYGIPQDKEVKWSYLWSLRRCLKKGMIRKDAPYYFLKNFKEKELIRFINETLELFENCNYCKAIFTVTFNSPTLTPRIAPENIYSMHLQELMQRIEMDIQNEENNLAILFFDPVSGEIDRQLRKGYKQIYSSGDFIKTYRHIKDSISFELSHHSFGVQLADYCVGIFQGMLKGYNTSSELFRERIWNILRKSPKGDAFGYGIREIPSNIENRTFLRGIIQKATREEEDIPF